MKILACDPGDRTGIAVCNTENDYAFNSWEEDDIDRMLENIYIDVVSASYDLVIIENFIIHSDTAKKKKPQRWPLEMIGAIRWICYSRGQPFIIQTPSQKDWMDDDKLKRLGWYRGSANSYAGHADDAARHLGVYLGVTRQDQDFLRKLI